MTKPRTSPRRFVCEGCGKRKVARPNGRLPKRCDECVPQKVRTQRRRASSAERDKMRAQAEMAAAEIRRLRSDLRVTRRRLTIAQQARPPVAEVRREKNMTEEAIFDEVETRARAFGPPGLDAVKRCLVRLRHAEGAHGTADAADDLARALIVWARVLRADSQGRMGEDSRLREAA